MNEQLRKAIEEKKEIASIRPYEARQEELVRAINLAIITKTASQELLMQLRHTLIEEQVNLLGPSLAFISGCRLLNRLDLM